jgi:hypothetical protein
MARIVTPEAAQIEGTGNHHAPIKAVSRMPALSMIPSSTGLDAGKNVRKRRIIAEPLIYDQLRPTIN